MGSTRVYRISLAMIVKDEARSIVRCLESVRDVVDEMVVVDTGSQDDTVALAQGAGAVVHHFTWVDDFAAARNAAIDHCTGDWVLILDADEWLDAGAEALASLRSTAPDFAGVVEVVSHTDGGTESWLEQVRVLPPGVHYAGRVHEQPQLAGPARRLGARIGHDGYQPEQRERKVGRNRQLLEAALVEEPDNAYLWFQLAREHDQTGSHAAACLGFERAGQLIGTTTPPWAHHLVVRHIACLTLTGRTQDAIDLAVAELERWQRSADFQFMLGQALLRHAAMHPELRDQLLPLAEQAWQTCLALGDAKLTGSVTGHGGFLAARELVRLYERLGRTTDADELRPLADRRV